MTVHRARLFGEIAVADGLCTEDELEQALAEQAELRKRGIIKTLGAVLHDSEVLSLVQVNQVLEKVDTTRRRFSIDGYEIVSRLGRGGMGAVYLARRLTLNKLVAIKVLKPKLAHDKGYLDRFRREAAATAKLNHPNIVAAFDVGASNGYNYFVMEYIEGETLSAMLSRQGIIEEEQALEILTPIADALDHAYEHGIVHRDIKPANIMVSRQGVPKLCDLGLAIDRTEDRSITRSGVIMGTPYYLSPEQARSEALDSRSDIYSLGATLFHMITGCVPYEGDTPAVVITRHLNDPVPDPLEINPVLSNSVCYVVARMLAKRPQDRYQTPQELCTDLRELLVTKRLEGRRYNPDGPVSVRAPGVSKQRSRLRWIAGALGVVAVGVVGLAAIAPERVAKLPALALGYVRDGTWLADRVRAPIERQRESTLREEREVAATRALERADAEIAKDPLDLLAARQRLASVVEGHPGTDAAARAQSRLRSIAESLENEARSAFFEVAARARALADEGRLREAREALLAFPQTFGGTSWAAQAARELALIEEATERRWRALDLEAEEHLRAGRYRQARALFAEGLDLGLGPIAAAATKRLAWLESVAAGADARDATEEARARERRFGKALAASAQAAREGGYGAGAARARELSTVTDGGPDASPRGLGDALRALARDLDALASARASALAELASRRGQSVTLSVGGVRRTGVLEAVEPERVLLKLGGAAVGYPVSSLDPSSWLDPAHVGGAGRAAVLEGLALLVDGRAEDAARAFARAHDLGERGAAPYLTYPSPAPGG